MTNSKFYGTLSKMQSLTEHLLSRHMNLQLHHPVLDEVEDVATFYLWNLSGKLCGYQQYRRFGEKKPNNNPKEGKYFTHRKLPTVTVWGVESLHLSPNVVFVTEGVFDACRMTNVGYSAVAVLGNDPPYDVGQWLNALGRKVVVVADNDKAGLNLAKFGQYVEFTDEKDLGDSDQFYVNFLVEKYG